MALPAFLGSIRNQTKDINSERPVLSQRRLVINLIALIGICLIGLVIRLHGLDAVGIYHDEKYMVLAVSGVLDNGLPYMPSGMLYPRALNHIYITTISVSILGETEFAYRLPSAIAGTACIVASYFLGRIFFGTPLCIAFVSVVAFFPFFIEISQIARMYVFLLLYSILFLIFLAKWQHSGSWAPVSLAGVILVLGIETQILFLLVTPLIVIPMIIRLDFKTLVQGIILGIIAGTTYVIIETFVAAQYAGTISNLTEESFSRYAHPSGIIFSYYSYTAAIAVLALGMLYVLATFAIGLKRIRKDWSNLNSETKLWLTVGLAALNLSVFFSLFWIYIVSIPLLIVASLLLTRLNITNILVIGIAIFFLIFISQTTYMYAISNSRELDVLLREFISFPSPVPFVRFFFLLFPAFLIFSVLSIRDSWVFSKGKPLQIYLLLFVIGVFLPLAVMGSEKWSVPLRYMTSQFYIFIFCFFLAFKSLTEQLKINKRSPYYAVIVLFMSMVIFVSPAALLAALDRSYERYPDHKGAAEFMESVSLNKGDIVMVMEAPIQYHYLGSFDYVLRKLESVAWQARPIDGKIFDIFTGTEIIYDAESLYNILADADRGAVYIVYSGEIFGDYAMQRNLGDEMGALIESYKPQEIFRGRDDKTHVSKIR